MTWPTLAATGEMGKALTNAKNSLRDSATWRALAGVPAGPENNDAAEAPIWLRAVPSTPSAGKVEFSYPLALLAMGPWTAGKFAEGASSDGWYIPQGTIGLMLWLRVPDTYRDETTREGKAGEAHMWALNQADGIIAEIAARAAAQESGYLIATPIELEAVERSTEAQAQINEDFYLLMIRLGYNV